MEPQSQAHRVFHLTRKRVNGGLEEFDPLALRPALLAGYRNLTRLRYDFPLVLNRNAVNGYGIRSLSGLIDSLDLPDGERDRTRGQLLRLEEEIRVLLASGASGTLAALWDQAACRLGLQTAGLARLRPALEHDAEVVDCTGAMPVRVLVHAWRQLQANKVSRLQSAVGRLIHKLGDILREDFVRSEAGRSAESLKAAMGGGHGEVFDFDALSELLIRSAPGSALGKGHRERIGRLLSVLESHRLFTLAYGSGTEAAADGCEPLSFVFDNCAAAVKAYRERLPRVVELAKAIALSEYEVKGEYTAANYDPFFDEFGEHMLGPKNFELFPDYLVCLNQQDLNSADNAVLPEILAAGLPMKIMVQTDDILEPSPFGGHLSLGAQCKQLAAMAVGLNDVYVLQASASHLYQYRQRLVDGLSYAGPALFSVFSGESAQAGFLPPYLVAAAAMESRAFPAFSYDPSAGTDWASCFCLEGNPQADLDWPVHESHYQDEEHQSVRERLPMTLVDFVACDQRYAKCFARVPRSSWGGHMTPVGECVADEVDAPAEDVPTLLMVDDEDRLQKVIVDDELVREARRCARMWHSLQELGGIHNSHAERLLARERDAWEAQRNQEPAAAAPASADEPPLEPVAGTSATTVAETAPEPSADDAYIETPRCTTCDECVQVNGEMFAYDANKQAYIKDSGAGTYRQLVEAAESCQVAIIHPGKPCNPDEPGLEELLERAKPFL